MSEASRLPVRFVMYTSEALEPFSPQELENLLDQARRKNAGLRISGLLLYRAARFAQVLEGPEAAVESVYRSIERDPRHHRMVRWVDGHRAHREYPNWSMGFLSLESQRPRPPGFTDLIDDPLVSPEPHCMPSQCRVLMRAWDRLVKMSAYGRA